MKTRHTLIATMLIAAPFVYLALIWSELPASVPTHFTSKGPDDWSGKGFLWFIPSCLPLFIFGMMKIIPLIDPKRKLKQMGEKYDALTLLLTFFISLLSLYTIYVAKAGELDKPEFLYALLGGLFAALGNYLQTVRPNYFVGLRTPWTLENEAVWKKTHLLGGKIWTAGGILLIILAFVVPSSYMSILMPTLVAVMIIAPTVYSYRLFQLYKSAGPDGESKPE
jgi:uncharacterized membrane protein